MNDSINITDKNGGHRGGKRPGAGRKPVMGTYVDMPAVLKAIGESRGMMTLVARGAGCSQNTVRAWRHQYPEIAQAFEDAEEQQLDITELQLFKLINESNLGAVIWYLKTKGRKRGYTEYPPLSSQGSGGMNVQVDMDVRVLINKIEHLRLEAPKDA